MESEKPYGVGEIDLPAAAERLLVALSFIASKLKDRPVPAIQLCAHVFDRKAREEWSHETRRRRVRDVVKEARNILRTRNQGAEIAADGRGYWITKDAGVITWYASQRRRQGLQDLAAGKQAADAVANAGQKSLFPELSRRI
jgi:hypothetical protein